MFGLYWDRTCLNTDLCNSLESHGAPAQPGASVQTITLSLVKGWAVSRCTESAAPELYKEASNSTQALLHFRQSSGVCLCLLHSCLCAPQTDCWVHPCTAGGGHQVPRQLALLSSPLWLAAQLQRCDKVLYVLCLVTVCLRCLLSVRTACQPVTKDDVFVLTANLPLYLIAITHMHRNWTQWRQLLLTKLKTYWEVQGCFTICFYLREDIY